ncbi:MAG: MBOAT family protein [Candidatus Magasanikbacteria bacterium]|nr:MBOAT family protein [Candidatus Magasanikbacteria bacterium]
MIFNSFIFFIFFPVVTAVYFMMPHRFRWLWLLLSSCVFYMAFIPVYILILFTTIIVDYIAGILIDRSSGARRKAYLIISIISNIGFLAFFKYYGFASGNLNVLMQALHWNYSMPILKIILPIGLSFHTFQALSYTIEVYRGNQKAERHFGIYALYVMFYPQLVAGPIERPQNLLHQFREKHEFSWPRVSSGLSLMLWGFFKKIVIADNSATIVNRVFDYPTQFYGWPLIIAVILFAFQIYGDFSGYTDIAIGSAKVMGFKLMNNFDRPYFSKSVGEFWRRWNISLSSWFRDYVYIPLGGKLVAKWRRSLNIMIVFLLSGLWHGAAWNYVIWGGLLGCYIVISIWTKALREKIINFIRFDQSLRLRAFLQMIITFFLISISWILFRAKSIADAVYIFRHFFVGLGDYFLRAGSFIRLSGVLGVSTFSLAHIFIAIIFMEYVHFRIKNGTLGEALAARAPWVRWTFYNALMLWIIFFGYFGERPFIYFQF